MMNRFRIVLLLGIISLAPVFAGGSKDPSPGGSTETAAPYTVTVAGQQMVEILRCIVAQPKVIILDEPTSGLNNRETDFLLETL
jgi:hypothetical protein